MENKPIEALEVVAYQLDYWLPDCEKERSEDGLVDVRLERCRQANGPDRWAIREWRFVLNKQGQWEREPDKPAGRNAEFLARCRFDTVREALGFWNKGHKSPLAYHRDNEDVSRNGHKVEV